VSAVNESPVRHPDWHKVHEVAMPLLGLCGRDRRATHLPEGATRAAIDKLERHERRHSSKAQQGKQAETK